MTLRDIFDQDPTPKLEYRRRLSVLRHAKQQADQASEKMAQELLSAQRALERQVDETTELERRLKTTRSTSEHAIQKLSELARRLYALELALHSVLPAQLKRNPRCEVGTPPSFDKGVSDDSRALVGMTRGIESQLDRMYMVLQMTGNAAAGHLELRPATAELMSSTTPASHVGGVNSVEQSDSDDQTRALSELDLEVSRKRSELAVLTARFEERSSDLLALDQLRLEVEQSRIKVDAAELRRLTVESELQAATKLLDIRRVRMDFLEEKIEQLRGEIAAPSRSDNQSWMLSLGRYFSSEPVLNWLISCHPGPAGEFFGGRVRLIGDGPWGALALRDAMQSADIPLDSKPESSGMSQAWIIGSHSADVDRVRVDAMAAESEVFLYTQEEWVLFLATGFDPTEQEDALALQPNGHPIAGEDPAMDNRRILGPGSDVSNEELQFSGGNSPLAHFGYSVGYEGLASDQRQRILMRVLTESLPDECFEGRDSRYRARWGAPRSPTRLRRIATHLGWLVKLHRPTPGKSLSVAEWQEDLRWLRDRCYVGRMRTFLWPNGPEG